MINVDVHCPNDECTAIEEYECEYEDAEEGSEHKIKCSECNSIIKFTIEFEPLACDEEIVYDNV